MSEQDQGHESSKLFHSAEEEFRLFAKNAQEGSAAFQLAFADQNFLLRKELRPVRLQLELLKADMIQEEHHIFSTVVIFGSARIPSSIEAEAELLQAKAAVAADPENPRLQQRYKKAERISAKTNYYEEARKLGHLISSICQDEEICHFVVVTGGGPGIMEAANRGAFDAGAKSIGFNIVLPLEQGPNPYITPELTFQFHYFAIRKMHFLIRARALIAFPGGFGTLDELFEALTLMQTRKIEPMPVLLFGENFWRNVINFEYLVEEGMIDHDDLNLFRYVETAEQAWRYISEFYEVD